MTAKTPSTAPVSADLDPDDDAPDLSVEPWAGRLAAAPVRRGRPCAARPKVQTTLRLSAEVLDHFKAGGPGWQSRIDAALRDWVRRDR